VAVERSVAIKVIQKKLVVFRAEMKVVLGRKIILFGKTLTREEKKEQEKEGG